MGQKATQLRGELRELVKANVPEHFLGAFTDDPADLETAQQFCRTLAERNLLCMAWPAEFGGGGASVWEQTVVREEMWAHHEPRGAQYMGVNWVGPIMQRIGRTWIAGSSIGTRKIVRPCCFFSPFDVRASRKHHCAIVAYDVQIF